MSSVFEMRPLTFQEFDQIRKLIFGAAGITLADNKMELVQSRIGRRVRENNFETFQQYYDFVVNDRSGSEMIQLLDAISINLTSFFREPNHFAYLNQWLPDLLAEKNKRGDRRIRAWSAGCSTGEEPYSLGMTLLDHVAASTWDVRLLATDLSTRVLAQAQQGQYEAERVRGIAPRMIGQYMKQGTGDWATHYKIADNVSGIIVFRRVNLMEPYPFKGPFDFIFCRNVMIYFSREVQQKLVQRYYDLLAPGGHLFIGHSESLSSYDHKFTYIKPTIYRK